MSRRDFFDEAHMPTANRIVPATSCVIEDGTGAICLIERSDNGLWSIPGGTMEPGETIMACVVRETLEETGLVVEVERLVGIYSNPRHVVAYDDGEVRQEFSLCFGARLTSGDLRTSPESLQVRFVPIEQLDGYDIHVSVRQRIDDYLARSDVPFTR